MINFITYNKSSGLIESVQQTPFNILPNVIDGMEFKVIDGDMRSKIFLKSEIDYFYEKSSNSVFMKDDSGKKLEGKWPL